MKITIIFDHTSYLRLKFHKILQRLIASSVLTSRLATLNTLSKNMKVFKAIFRLTFSIAFVYITLHSPRMLISDNDRLPYLLSPGFMCMRGYKWLWCLISFMKKGNSLRLLVNRMSLAMVSKPEESFSASGKVTQFP